MVRAYEEIVEFIAAGTQPETVAAFRASEETRNRVAQLLDLEKQGVLSSEETSELQHYLQIEHLMRLAKARAHQHLKR
jgi:hypothetical protein